MGSPAHADEDRFTKKYKFGGERLGDLAEREL